MECGAALNEHIEQLVAAARSAMRNAYAPYSRFAVGAAIRLSDGSIITGSNFENASYGLSLCAEAVAVASANAAGRLKDIEGLAVAGGPIGQGPASNHQIARPCGRCRQILHEAEQAVGRTIPIYCAAAEGNQVEIYSLSELLPHAFGPANLDAAASCGHMGNGETQAKDA